MSVAAGGGGGGGQVPSGQQRARVADPLVGAAGLPARLQADPPDTLDDGTLDYSERAAAARSFPAPAVHRLVEVNRALADQVAGKAFLRARRRGPREKVTVQDVDEAYLELVEPAKSALADPVTALGASISLGSAGAIGSVFATTGTHPNIAVLTVSLIGFALGGIVAAFGFGRASGSRNTRRNRKRKTAR